MTAVNVGFGVFVNNTTAEIFDHSLAKSLPFGQRLEQHTKSCGSRSARLDPSTRLREKNAENNNCRQILLSRARLSRWLAICYDLSTEEQQPRADLYLFKDVLETLLGYGQKKLQGLSQSQLDSEAPPTAEEDANARGQC
jgi:hypothetical protein